MPLIHGKRRQDGKHGLVEDHRRRLFFLFGQFVPSEEMDALGGQGRLDGPVIPFRLPVQHLLDRGMDGVEKPLGRLLAHVRAFHSGPDLLAQAIDPLHHELVQVRGGDGEEVDPLQERSPFIQRLVQNAPVELQPIQVAVQEPGSIGRFAAASPERSLGRPHHTPGTSPMQVPTSRAVLTHGWLAGTFLMTPATLFNGTGTHSSPRTATMTL